MFILRRITHEGGEQNIYLGENYSLVHYVQQAKDFKTNCEILGINNTDVYGLVFYENGGKQIPLMKESIYYIMSDNGNTFANITNKF